MLDHAIRSVKSAMGRLEPGSKVLASDLLASMRRGKKLADALLRESDIIMDTADLLLEQIEEDET